MFNFGGEFDMHCIPLPSSIVPGKCMDSRRLGVIEESVDHLKQQENERIRITAEISSQIL